MDNRAVDPLYLKLKDIAVSNNFNLDSLQLLFKQRQKTIYAI